MENVTEKNRVIDGLVRKGVSKKEIGIALGVSPSTLRNHFYSELLPPRYAFPLKQLCAANDVDCPDQAFRWGNTG